MTAGRLLVRGREAAGPAGLDQREWMPASRAVAATLAVALVGGGATLLLRRIGGGFTVTPGPELAWTVAAAGWLLVAATDLGGRIGGEAWPSWLARGGLAAAALAVAPIGAGLSWPSRLAGGCAVAFALVAAVVAPPRRRPVGSRMRGRRQERAEPTGGGAAEPVAEGGRAPSPAGEQAEPGVGIPGGMAAGFRQRLERFETPAGDDCLRGQLLLAVPAGSRTGHAHVGFCPPFAGTPQLEATTECDFVEAEITAAEVLPWGARIECRLSEPAEEPLEIPVAVLARHPR